MTIQILLVDDHTIVRQGLRSLLEREADLAVVAEADSGTQAVDLAAEYLPDVVLMDVNMPGMNGIDATRKIVSAYPAARILALSMENDRRFVVEVLKAGATGYLLKDCAYGELAEAIRLVARGETYLPPKIVSLVVKDYLQRVPADGCGGDETLTPREREILQMLAAGKNSKEIAFALGVSLKTVENQRSSIMKKLNLFSIAELTKYAVREGLTALR